MLRHLGASVLALGVVLTGTAQPARADYADKVITVGFSVFRIIRGGLTEAEVEILLGVTVDAVSTAKNEVIDRIDSGDAARAKAAATNVTIQFLSYEQIRQSPFSLYTFFSYAADRALLDSYNLDVVGREAGDEIGHALNTHYPIVMLASHELGMEPSRDAYQREYVAANRKLLEKLKPVCTPTPGELDPLPNVYEVDWECTAANGEKSYGKDYQVGDNWLSGPVNVDDLRIQAARNSSWLVAKRVLEELQP